jgi:glycosyltransferase involved in cell wall biosynthesis
MKILMIAHLVPYPLHGGVRIRNFNLLKEASRRHEIHLFAFTQKAHQSDDDTLRESLDAIRPYCHHLEVFEIPTDRSPWRWYALLLMNLLSSVPYSAWRYYSRDMAAAIRRHVREHRFDVVEFGTVALARFAPLVPDAPRLMVHHNIESQLLLRRSKHVPRLTERIYLAFQAAKLRRYERKTAPWFVRHTTCSEQDRQALTSIAPGVRAVVVPNGFDTDYFKPVETPMEENSIVFVGSMGWFPNLDGMLYFRNEVWPLLKVQVPDVKAYVIGTEAPPELKRFSTQDNNFRLLGFVDDIRPIVARSAVFAVPLRVGGGTRLKIIEAMAMGKAIVSTSVGCEGIEVTHGDNILIADTPSSFAESIACILTDPDLRCRLGAHARKTASEKYTWERIGIKLDQAYRECAAEHAATPRI